MTNIIDAKEVTTIETSDLTAITGGLSQLEFTPPNRVPPQQVANANEWVQQYARPAYSGGW
jgi:hypothetical protein